MKTILSGLLLIIITACFACNSHSSSASNAHIDSTIKTPPLGNRNVDTSVINGNNIQGDTTNAKDKK